MLRKLLKIFTALTLLLIISITAIYLIHNKALPEGENRPQADALAEKMLKAVNEEAYRNTRYLEWTFRNGEHVYKWDKALGLVAISWDDFSINLNLNTPHKSEVAKNGIKLKSGAKRDAVISEALSLFNNDSFWLVAPFKVFDKGTERSIVKLEDGTNALLVTYTSGGSTPGDSYLWKLQPNGFPDSFQMWVKIIPIGGFEASWDDWQLTESGAFLPKSHILGPMKLDMGDVKAYNP